MATYFCTAPAAGFAPSQPELKVLAPRQPDDLLQLDEWFPAALPDDPEGEAALVRRLTPLILKLVRSHQPRRESEEDLVQTILIKIFRKFSQYSGEVPLVHWVSRIAINTCLNQYSREKCRPEVRHADLSEEEASHIERTQSEPGGRSPAEILEMSELAESLLSGLPAEDRRVLELLYIDRHSIEETSALTGFTPGAVKVRAFRARARLRETLPRLLRETPRGLSVPS